jgi:hypothetical protein
VHAGGYTAFPVHIMTSVSSAPTTISANAVQASFGAAILLFRSGPAAKYSTAISKNRMKKISMVMP